jgi:hypothetical protein
MCDINLHLPSPKQRGRSGEREKREGRVHYSQSSLPNTPTPLFFGPAHLCTLLSKQRYLSRKLYDLGFEVSMAVTMDNAVFRVVAPSGFIINRRFGGTCRLHLQGRRNNMGEEKF